MSIELTGRTTARRNGRRQAGATLMGLLMAAALVAGCGSDDNEDSASVVPAAQGSASADSGGADASGDVAKAQAIVDQATKAPTSLPITEPLTAAPEKGKTIVFMKTTDDPSSSGQLASLKAAAATVGWNVKDIGFQLANPATLVAGLKQALDLKPVAVALSAQPQVVWQSVIPDYKKAGVGLIAAYVGPLELQDPVIANIAGASYEEQMASYVGNWFIADSEGKGKALQYNVTELPTLKHYGDTLTDTVKKGCADCQIKTLVGSIAQAAGGQSVPAIVSALQRDPSITYLLTDYGAWVQGLRGQLNAAGLSKVKIAGSSALPANLAAVKAGTESAFTTLNNPYSAWAVLDAALRYDQRQAIQNGNSDIPFQLAVTGGDFEVSDNWTAPADYQEQFKKLWKVG